MMAQAYSPRRLCTALSNPSASPSDWAGMNHAYGARVVGTFYGGVALDTEDRIHATRIPF